MDTDSSDDNEVKEDMYEPTDDSDNSDSDCAVQNDDQLQPRIKRRRKPNSLESDDFVYLSHGSEWTEFGPVDEIKDITDPLEIFSLFITDNLIDDILIHTNQEITATRGNYKREHVIADTNAKEIKAVIGLLIQSAASRSNHLPLSYLFNTKYSGFIYKANSSSDRCQFILRCLRFSETTKPDSKYENVLAPINNMWSSFVTQCTALYKPGNFLTMGEYMIPYRGSCPIKTFSSNHECRYGIEIIMLIDVCSKYVLNACPFIPSNSKQLQNAKVVKQLTEHLYGSYRNITLSNGLISVPLAKQFLQKPYELTLVGDLKSKIPVPKSELIKEEKLQSESSMFGHEGDMKLLSFKPTQKKRQFILSTLHKQPFGSDEMNNVDLLKFFNKTKGALDEVRRTRSKSSVDRRTDSWCTSIFYFIIDIALINSYNIYVSNMNRKSEKCVNRRDFLLMLSEQLMRPWLEVRYTVLCLPRYTKEYIKDILGKDFVHNLNNSTVSQTDNSINTSKTVRKSCSFCPTRLRRMTRTNCRGCQKYICGEHNVPMCYVCFENFE